MKLEIKLNSDNYMFYIYQHNTITIHVMNFTPVAKTPREKGLFSQFVCVW